MPTNRWRGDAPAVAQVTTFTVASSTAAQTFTITINGKVISYTAGGSETTATIAAALYALLNASTIAEFAEIFWSYPGSGAVITATAASPGMPFTATAGGTGTLNAATPTASKGPNDASTLANWSTGALPAAAEDVLIDGGGDILWGLNVLSAAALNSLRIKASYTGKIGLPVHADSTGYFEYRTRGFPVGTTVPVTIGEGDGSGPSRVFLNQTTSMNLTVVKTQARQSGPTPIVNIFGASAGTLNVTAGDVGIAADDDTTTATVATVNMGTGATLTNGKGGTITTLNQAGGTVSNLGSVGTVNAKGGTFNHYGAISAAVNADPGPFRFNWLTGGTIPAATFRGQGANQTAPIMDCTVDPRAKTMTAHTFTGGAALLDPDQLTTWSAAGTWDAASLGASQLGQRFTLLRT